MGAMTPREYQQLYDQLVGHEQKRLFPYDDATGKTIEPGDTLKGNITIAIGVNLSAGISNQECDMLTSHRMEDAWIDLFSSFPWFRPLAWPQQRVLMDMRYQLGAAGFRGFHLMVAALEHHDLTLALQEIINSRLARQHSGRVAHLVRLWNGHETADRTLNA